MTTDGEKSAKNECQKPLRERERELRSLLATATGRDKLQTLACHYAAANGQREPVGSVITYILVHEREQGRII